MESSTQVAKVFDQAEKERIIVEEWLGTEFDLAARQLNENPDYYLTKVRFIGVNGLVKREDGKAAAIAYVDEQHTDGTIAIFSVPIIKALNNASFIIFVKIVLQTLVIKREKGNDTYENAEIKAYEKHLNSLKYVNDTKKIQQIEKARQAIMFHLFRFSRNVPIHVPEKVVSELIEDLDIKQKVLTAFNKAKTRTLDVESSQVIKDLKIRSLPFVFQFIVENTGERRISPVTTLEIHSGPSIILFSEIFAKNLPVADLEVIISYEILNLLNYKKYKRGKMEQEIYEIISTRSKDVAEKNTSFLYTKSRLTTVKEQTKKTLEEIVGDEVMKARIIKVY
ncbi:MAG: hypothetical protein ACXAEU_20125 [Candidatus Hodarchaeales archaeon]|jgi:hypothetical protein